MKMCSMRASALEREVAHAGAGVDEHVVVDEEGCGPAAGRDGAGTAEDLDDHLLSKVRVPSQSGGSGCSGQRAMRSPSWRYRPLNAESPKPPLQGGQRSAPARHPAGGRRPRQGSRSHSSAYRGCAAWACNGGVKSVTACCALDAHAIDLDQRQPRAMASRVARRRARRCRRRASTLDARPVHRVAHHRVAAADVGTHVAHADQAGVDADAQPIPASRARWLRLSLGLRPSMVAPRRAAHGRRRPQQAPRI